MKIHNQENFISIIRDSIIPLSKEEFLETIYIGTTWDRIVKKDKNDIRVLKLKTKSNFYEWCYNFIHSDEPLILYFNQRLRYNKTVHEAVESSSKVSSKINNTGNITDSVKHISNNVRFIRNINLYSILNCEGADGKSIKNIYKDALERGKIDRCMTVPSVFKDSYDKNYSTFVVTMKTVSGQMSILSPTIFSLLLDKADKYCDVDKQKMLVPSASWGTPVLSTLNKENYTDIHIVDVQNDVLGISKGLFDDHNKRVSLFGVESPYKLKTFCIPSERMTEVIDTDYDKVFFCPPYYDLELYGGSDLQSTTLYNTYEKWLDSYWRKTVEGCNDVLKSGGLFCFIMGIQCRNHMIGSDMKTIAEERFSLVNETRILPPVESTRDSNTIEKYEICYIMKKDK